MTSADSRRPSLPSTRALLAVALALMGVGASAAAGTGPVILDLSVSTAAHGQRLVVDGTDFGTEVPGAELRIGGVPAVIASWSDTSVRGYVPAGTAVGSVGVNVVTPAGMSNTALLQVTPRIPSGRALWRVEMNHQTMIHRPAVADDGTVYAKSSAGDLVAITPQGTVDWLFEVGIDTQPAIDVGHDGTIYTADGWPVIKAINPDGTLKWTFTDLPSQGVIAGPNVGPDGNLYVVSHAPGLGLYSLTPQGDLRWVEPGPEYAPYGQLGQEIVFSSDQLFFCLDNNFDSFDFDGNVQFEASTVTPDSSDSPQPAVGPNGDSYVEFWNRMQSYSPDGTLQWTAFDVNGNTMDDPEVGPDGTLYVVRNLINLYALNPDGSEKWTYVQPDSMQSPVPSPGGDVILVGGANNGQPGFIQAVDPDGAALWRVSLPIEPNGPFSTWDVKPQGRPRFTADGSVAYVCATGPSDPISTSYVYAVQVASMVDLGYGMSGTNGMPRLDGTGALTGNSPITLTTSQLAPGAPFWLVVGFSPLGAPLRGGVLVPAADIVVPLFADASGAVTLAATWPDGLPPDTAVYLQCWIPDGAGPVGFAATNALSLITP